MTDAFKAVQVTDRVWWVGAIDWDVRNFHGYLTSRGTTYNAFLVLAETTALIDTVKAPFRDEMLARIASVIEPQRIETIVSNHSEMDHSGCLPAAIKAIRPRQVFASANGAEALARHFHDIDVTAVGDGQQLSLGNATLTFAETKMCHWPDSMVSYLHEDALLFSQDAFGMHLASSERYADELDGALVAGEAAKYYANILLPLSGAVKKALAKLAALKLPLAIVAPDHGPMYRGEQAIAGILDSYRRWAGQQRTNKAVVLYDTMWNSTARMARAVGEGLAAGGASAKLLSANVCHRSDVATELLDAGALVVGSPTINNMIFPTLGDVLTYVQGLRPVGLVGATFGSYGWSGQAPQQLHRMLADMKVEMIREPLRVKYVPDDAALAECRRLGQAVAERLAERAEPAA